MQCQDGVALVRMRVKSECRVGIWSVQDVMPCIFSRPPLASLSPTMLTAEALLIVERQTYSMQPVEDMITEEDARRTLFSKAVPPIPSILGDDRPMTTFVRRMNTFYEDGSENSSVTSNALDVSRLSLVRLTAPSTNRNVTDQMSPRALCLGISTRTC